VKRVPCQVKSFNALGGKPIPNSSTSILVNRPTIKWPNSCKRMIKPRARMNSKIEISVFKIFSRQFYFRNLLLYLLRNQLILE
jgi:hypothetical protein